MTVPQPIPVRPTARVLALDAAGRGFLLRHVDERRARICPGESLPATVVRELREETGLVADRVWVDAVAVDRVVGSA